MESVAYDDVSLGDISFDDDELGLALDEDVTDISHITFVDDPDDAELTLDDLEPDDELAGITFEEPDDDLTIDLEIDE